MGIPASYKDINKYNASYAPSPSTIHVANTLLTNFFQKYLLQKVISLYKWTFPEWWSPDYFLYTLYVQGRICILNTDKFGAIPQECTLGGFNIFYEPRTAIVTNPLLKKPFDLLIDQNCTIIKLQPDYGSIMDIVSYYADMLATCAETAQVNIFNSRLSYVFTAQNKSTAESFKKMYDSIASGEAMVVQDARLKTADGEDAWSLFSSNLSQNYIAGDILSDMRKIEQMFDTDVGINNANTDKKERLISSEVESNNQSTQTKAALWLETIQRGVDKAKAMFPDISELSVEMRFNPAENYTDIDTPEDSDDWEDE